MADNTALNAGAGGDTISTDDVGGGVKVQRVKLQTGADGTAVDVLPVSNGMDNAGTNIPAAGIVGQLDDTGTGTVTENQFAPVRISTRRALLVEGVASGTAVPVSLASAPSTAVTNAGTFAVQATLQASSGTDIGKLTANQTVDIAKIAGGTAINSGVTGALAAGGDVAHDGVNTGNPIQLGAVAISYGTNPTAVSTSLDRTQLYANMAGVLFTMGGHPNAITIELAFTASQTDVAIVTVAGGAKIVVTRCSFFCSHANTVDVAVRVGFGAANTPTTTGVVLTHPNVAAGSGVVEGDGSGMLGVGADGEDLRITATVPTTGSARVLVTYFTTTS